MSIVQNPIIGRCRKSAGGMTFTTTLRKNVMKAKAFEVRNPKTVAQTLHRTKFGRASKISASFDEIHIIGLASESSAKKVYPSNILTSQFVKATKIDARDELYIDASNVSIGQGQEIGIDLTAIYITGTGALRVEWSNERRANAGLPSVEVGILMVNNDEDEGEQPEPKPLTEDEFYEDANPPINIGVGSDVSVWLATINIATAKTSLYSSNGISHTILPLVP